MDLSAESIDIARHIERNIGRIAETFGEIVDGEPPLFIHHIKSSFFRRFEVVLTSGMSSSPMTVPEDCPESPFAELLVLLPKGWPLTQSAFGREQNYWPVRLLKTTARYPFESGSWLGFGHTVANGSSETNTQPYAPGTNLCAAIVLPPLSLGEKAWIMKRKDGSEVCFWSLLPIHMEELKFKLKNGVDPLLDLFDRHGVKDVIDPNRASVIDGAA